MAPLVVLDAGHGGTDSGAVGNGLREADLTLKLVKRIRTVLERDYEVEVDLTRSADTTVSLDDRAAFANGKNADFFLSVHINSNQGAPGSGFEDFIHDALSDSSRSAILRSAIHNRIMATLDDRGVADRGKKKADFAVLRETNMPAVLTENLFINNPQDAQLLGNNDFMRSLAKAHARGIALGLNLLRKNS